METPSASITAVSVETFRIPVDLTEKLIASVVARATTRSAAFPASARL